MSLQYSRVEQGKRRGISDESENSSGKEKNIKGEEEN